MKNSIVHIALLVDDYDRAIDYYTRVLLFRLMEDKSMGGNKRWVRVAPQGNNSFSLLLARAGNEEQASRIGNQTGGRVFLFLHTDDFNAYYNHLVQNNVPIISGPSSEAWGTVAVFKDIYGNLWDLIQPA